MEIATNTGEILSGPDDGDPSVVEEEEEGPGAAPVEEIKEVVPFEPLQEDAAVDRTQEQDPARGLFRRTAQATVVMWKILQVPCVPQMVTVYFPHLLVHLLFQVFFSTLDMPEEVDTFWKGCQQQYSLATSPNRFAVRTLKSLLCQMQHEAVVLAMERKRGWDTLLCADTHHYAVGLLAREISRVSIPLCSHIARYLLRLLSTQEPRWELPALAFLVEVLECLNLSGGGANRVLQILSRHLRSKCRDRHRLALKALLKLNDNPSMDNSQVQLLSILLFQTLVSLPLEKDKKALKTHVRQSLLPLFFHCHDEDGRVAQASQETLLCVAQFLKRRDLEKVVKNKKLWKFTECLLADHSSRAAEHLRQAMPYLESPQEPLREAAIRFLGMAGRQLRGKKEELQLICEALEGMANDISVAVGSLAIQTLYVLQAVERAGYSILDSLHDQLRRAWRTRPRLLGLGWLRCWSSAES
ncbi:uncharacterized protein LOC128798676 isoform X2 [Vidua chalybeata]|uniref:uncharacterized protein LOC128798676 isoform X2 n=1 Tax=Vidua chalybeata TaxID=81927 RepID=UPI0023A8F7B8|nr:uncharacterized protein LOC128798676 isoform X2 [Vidua chalybeata]